MNVIVKDLIDSTLAISMRDGELLHEHLVEFLSKNADISIDFTNIDVITSAFLNSSIGQLYSGKYDWKDLDTRITYVADKMDLDLISRVIENAKRYFQNKERIDQLEEDE